MFRRIIVEEWQNALSIAALLLFFGSFLLSFLRVLAMPKSQVTNLKNLPLEPEQSNHETRN